MNLVRVLVQHSAQIGGRRYVVVTEHAQNPAVRPAPAWWPELGSEIHGLPLIGVLHQWYIHPVYDNVWAGQHGYLSEFYDI